MIPNLEFILINQHIKLHELNAKENALVNKTLGINNPRTLREELEEFLSRFSF
jgi:UDP-glucose 4-epimerase